MGGGGILFFRRCLPWGVNFFHTTISICTGPVPPINIAWSLIVNRWNLDKILVDLELAFKVVVFLFVFFFCLCFY